MPNGSRRVPRNRLGWRELRPCALATALSLLLSAALRGDDAAQVSPPIRDLDSLSIYAAGLSQRPYVEGPELPDSLRNLSYDDYRKIVHRADRPIWLNRERPLWLETFHRGYVHRERIDLHTVAESRDIPVAYSPDDFVYSGALRPSDLPDDLGFAGFRVVGVFPHDGRSAGVARPEELLVFLGGCYFRARNGANAYGSSARGLALNIGMNQDEEFPAFREFWVTEPQADEPLRILALLDGPSVTGGYEFTLIPGVVNTTIDVRARLYFRQPVEKVGLAPLTSMWMWGDGLAGPQGDHRPEVHDADGLLVELADGTWLWRALCRQIYPSLMRMTSAPVRGFGLIQRDRRLEHYHDLEAQYHRRPTVWITPREAWSEGAVELLELAAPHEGIDNIAAYWVPDSIDMSGGPVELEYRVTFLSGDPPQHRLAKAAGFRVLRDDPQRLGIEIDFAGETFARIPSGEMPTVRVTSVRGAVTSMECRPGADGRWTATLVIVPTGEGPMELTAVVMHDGRALTETWSYLCPLEVPPVSLPPWRLRASSQQASN